MMNQRNFAILLLMVVFFGCANPAIRFQEFRDDEIINYKQMEKIDNLSDYVFYLNKGEKIPLKLTLDSEIIEITDEVIYLVLKQKVYFRLKIPEGMNVENISAMSEENKQKLFKNLMFYLSLNAKSWAPYTDIKAVKKVFGLHGGSVSFGMGISKEDGLAIFLNAKAAKM